eukprot:9439310-Pyramimonas_sp.AAC.1
MEVWHAELQDEKGLLEATPLGDIFTMPTQVIPDHSALITVAEEQRGKPASVVAPARLRHRGDVFCPAVLH